MVQSESQFAFLIQILNVIFRVFKFWSELKTLYYDLLADWYAKRLNHFSMFSFYHICYSCSVCFCFNIIHSEGMGSDDVSNEINV